MRRVLNRFGKLGFRHAFQAQRFARYCVLLYDDRSGKLMCEVGALIGHLFVLTRIEFAPFDAIDELLDLGRISGGNVIVVFHRRRSRRSYAKRKRTPRPELKYFLFHDCLLQGHDHLGA